MRRTPQLKNLNYSTITILPPVDNKTGIYQCYIRGEGGKGNIQFQIGGFQDKQKSDQSDDQLICSVPYGIFPVKGIDPAKRGIQFRIPNEHLVSLKALDNWFRTWVLANRGFLFGEKHADYPEDRIIITSPIVPPTDKDDDDEEYPRDWWSLKSKCIDRTGITDEKKNWDHTYVGIVDGKKIKQGAPLDEITPSSDVVPTNVLNMVYFRSVKVDRKVDGKDKKVNCKEVGLSLRCKGMLLWPGPSRGNDASQFNLPEGIQTSTWTENDRKNDEYNTDDTLTVILNNKRERDDDNDSDSVKKTKTDPDTDHLFSQNQFQPFGNDTTASTVY